MRVPLAMIPIKSTNYPKRKFAAGSATILSLGLFLVILMISALAIDFGFYYANQNRLQTAADAAALAAINQLYKSDQTTPAGRQNDANLAAESLADDNWEGLTIDSGDITWGFISPQTKTYVSDTFETPSSDPDYAYTGGFNAVRVVTRRSDSSENGPLPTIMAKLFGVNTMNASARSLALIDDNIGTINNGGLRPIYACEGLLDLAMADGNLTNDVIRIYGTQVYINGQTVVNNCPAPGSGNWGFADLRNCHSDGVGTSTLRLWFSDGYSGIVNAGECYSTTPGNPISSISNQLDTLIADHTTFPIPVYNAWGGSGSNTNVTVSSFVGFQITSYKANGSESNRYIQGHFTPYICNHGCSRGPSAAAEDAPGGAVIKLRLAGG